MSVWIVETTLAVSAVVLVGLVASAGLRRQSAALRHWVLAMAMICAWLTPAARVVLPSWANVPLWRTGSDARLRPEAGLLSDGARVTLNAPPSAAPASVAESIQPAAIRVNRMQVLGTVWIVGSVMSALALLIGLVRLWSLASTATAIEAGPWREVVDEVRAAFGLSSPIRLLHSRHPSLLVAWGCRRPTVLLPASAETWSRDRIEIVVAHELAHIARRDWPWQLAGAALRTLYWFNPLLWMLASRLRAESERACDDAVLDRGIDGSTYATHLLMLARTLRYSVRELPLPASAMARPSHLEGRVRAMLNRNLDRRPISWKARVATIGVLVGVTLGVAGVRGQSAYYKLSGTLVDSTGRVLPDATVVLINGTNGAKYEVRSNASGRFEFVGLPQDTYTLKASLPGFAPLTWPEIHVAGDIDRQLQLRVGSLEESITVRGSSGVAPPLDAAAIQRREDGRRRAEQRLQKALAQCATGAAASSVGGNILPPAKLVDVKPIYPESSRASGVSGTVTLNAVIGTDGLVREVQNVSGPNPDLEAAAAAAVRQWEFSPTLLNCEATDVNMKVTVNFAAEQ